MEQHKIFCEDRNIIYQLTRKPVKNINLRVKPNGEIHVSANPGVSIEKINDFIYKNREFIFRALKKYSGQKKRTSLEEKNYQSGEVFRFLGKDLTLVLTKGKEEFVRYDGEHLYLQVQEPEDLSIKKYLVTKWYRTMTQEIFQKKCTEVYQMFQDYPVPFPRLTIRPMTSRWGSCRPDRAAITLNSHLILTEEKVIESVVVHEFAHFIHPNHSKDFYRLVQSIMPDYRIWERKLRFE